MAERLMFKAYSMIDKYLEKNEEEMKRLRTKGIEKLGVLTGVLDEISNLQREVEANENNGTEEQRN